MLAAGRAQRRTAFRATSARTMLLQMARAAEHKLRLAVKRLVAIGCSWPSATSGRAFGPDSTVVDCDLRHRPSILHGHHGRIMPLDHSASTPPEPRIDAPGAAPAAFNFVLYTVALGLLGSSAWSAWSIHVNSLPFWRLWFSIVCLVTLVGLLRRVA